MLRDQLRAMQLSNEEKDVENRNLQAQLNQKLEQDFCDIDEGISDEALRKRLNRLCERKKNGHLGYVFRNNTHTSNYSRMYYIQLLRHLQVPEEIHNLWLKGGEDRKLLGQRLQECGLDKESSIVTLVLLLCAFTDITCFLGICLQDKFITTVCLEIKEKEGVKIKIRAQWATEDKMRDVLKLREHLGCLCLFSVLTACQLRA